MNDPFYVPNGITYHADGSYTIRPRTPEECEAIAKWHDERVDDTPQGQFHQWSARVARSPHNDKPITFPRL